MVRGRLGVLLHALHLLRQQQRPVPRVAQHGDQRALLPHISMLAAPIHEPKTHLVKNEHLLGARVSVCEWLLAARVQRCQPLGLCWPPGKERKRSASVRSPGLDAACWGAAAGVCVRKRGQ